MKIYLFIITLFCFTNSYAGWTTSTGKVTSVYSHNGYHVIRTEITDNICTAGNFWWPADDPDAKDMFALAMAALMSDKRIRIAYADSNLNCLHGNSTLATHLVLIK